MATVVSQHVRHLGRRLGFFKTFILPITTANFLEISRKHVFAASNRNIIKNRVEKKKLEQILLKSYSFLIQTLNCVIKFAQIISDDVIQLMSKDTLIIGLQVLKESFCLLESFNFRSEKPMRVQKTLPSPLLDVRGLKTSLKIPFLYIAVFFTVGVH